LGELEISRVGGEKTSGAGVGGGQADLRVDIEHACGAARRPDNRRAVGFVVLEVVTVGGTLKFVFGAGLDTLSVLFLNFSHSTADLPEQFDQRSNKST
jgi:hypothetical protein